MKYFVVPDLLPADNKMTAYEYWFNAGPRVRVEVEPENPLTLNDLVIEIKDVVPNEIPADYRFDTSTETVCCADNVFFGMAACGMAATMWELHLPHHKEQPDCRRAAPRHTQDRLGRRPDRYRRGNQRGNNPPVSARRHLSAAMGRRRRAEDPDPVRIFLKSRASASLEKIRPANRI